MHMGAILPKIANHALDFGIGAACAGIEGLALYGASQCKDKFAKYSLIAVAIIAAIGATLAGSIAIGGTLLQLSGIQAAGWSTLSTALVSALAQIQVFNKVLTSSELIDADAAKTQLLDSPGQ